MACSPPIWLKRSGGRQISPYSDNDVERKASLYVPTKTSELPNAKAQILICQCPNIYWPMPKIFIVYFMPQFSIFI
jgi:hypothetical protein